MFPRSFYTTEPSFNALFRLLDDFDNYSRGIANNWITTTGTEASRVMRINPRFDVVETDTSYELHGELPGVSKDEISLEFTDPQTLVIRGRVERKYESGTPPSAAAPSGEEKKEQPAKESTEVATRTSETAVAQPMRKYWVSERSVGEFSRTFSFPVRVQQEAVKANLKDGVLTVSVPKAAKYEGYRITLN